MRKLIFFLLLIMASTAVIAAAPVMNTSYIEPTYPGESNNLLGFCNGTDTDEDIKQYNYQWWKNDILNTSGTFEYIAENYSYVGDAHVFYNAQQWAQTFNLTENVTVWKVKLNIKKSGSPTGNWNFSIKGVVGGVPNKTDIKVSQNYSISDLSTSNEWKEFILTNPVTLQKNTKYAFVYRCDDCPDSSNTIWIYGRDQSPADPDYLGGQGYTSSNNESSWSGQSLKDISFELFTHLSGNYNTINLSSTNTLSGENWTLSCQAYDGTSNSSWLNSSSVNIQNIVPAMNSSRISPTNPFTNDTLQGFCNATDDNGDQIRYYYNWFVNGLLNVSGNTSLFSEGIEVNVVNISTSLTLKDQNWTLQCLPSDDSLNGTATNTSQITIANTAPIVNSVNITTLPLEAGQNATIVYSCSDNDTIDTCNTTVEYNWWINGVNQSINDSTLTSGNTSVGDNVTGSVRVNDGTDWSAWVNTSTVQVVDTTAPSLSGFSVNPSSITTAETTTISVTCSDVSGVSAATAQVTDPNTVATNFSMSGSGSYSKVFTPTSGVGTYSVKVYCNDTLGNVDSTSSTSLTVTAPVVVGGGGGGGGGASKDVCNITVVPEELLLSPGVLTKLVLINGEEGTWLPSAEFVHNDGFDVTPDLLLSTRLGVILPGEEFTTGVKYDPGIVRNASNGTALLVFSSAECADVTVPITVTSDVTVIILPESIEEALGRLGENIFAGTKWENVNVPSWVMLVFYFLLIMGIASSRLRKAWVKKQRLTVLFTFLFAVVVSLALTSLSIIGIRNVLGGAV